MLFPHLFTKIQLAQHPLLKLLESFFINNLGERIEKWGEQVSYAAAIVQKHVTHSNQVTQGESFTVGESVQEQTTTLGNVTKTQ